MRELFSINTGLLVNMMRIMRSKMERERGRPPQPWHSYYDKRLFAYIIAISEKHGVNANKFLKKVREAQENKKVRMQPLTIQCREKTKEYSIFLITSKGKLVSQLRIPEYLLRETSNLKLKQENDL